jgi:hypothetical protein
MWNKSIVIIVFLFVCPVFLLAACDGATISDSIYRPENAAQQAEPSGSPTLIGSFPSQDPDGSSANDEAIHYLVVVHSFRLDLVADEGTIRFISHIKDKPVTIVGSLSLIALGIYTLSRRGRPTKTQHE